MNACAAAPLPDAGIDDHIQSVSGLSDSLLKQLRQSLQKIDEINRITRIISMNARIEAVRIGAAGRSFGVIAEEMDTLSRRVSDTAQEIDRMADRTSTDLRERLDRLQTDVRRTRLTDLALANINLIDRNLYERSCDVRWWATDAPWSPPPRTRTPRRSPTPASASGRSWTRTPSTSTWCWPTWTAP